MLLVRIAKDRALPFAVTAPNATTAATCEATDRGEGITRCKDAAGLLDKLRLGVLPPGHSSRFELDWLLVYKLESDAVIFERTDTRSD